MVVAYPVQGDEYNYHDSLQAQLMKGIERFTLFTLDFYA